MQAESRKGGAHRSGSSASAGDGPVYSLLLQQPAAWGWRYERTRGERVHTNVRARTHARARARARVMFWSTRRALRGALGVLVCHRSFASPLPSASMAQQRTGGISFFRCGAEPRVRPRAVFFCSPCPCLFGRAGKGEFVFRSTRRALRGALWLLFCFGAPGELLGEPSWCYSAPNARAPA